MKKAIFFLIIMLAICAACFAQTTTIRDVNNLKQSVYTKTGTDNAIKNATTPLATTESVTAATASNKAYTDNAIAALRTEMLQAIKDSAAKIRAEYTNSFKLLPKKQWAAPGTGIIFTIKGDTTIISKSN